MSELLVIDDCAAKIAERIAKNRVLSKEFVPDAVELTWSADIAVELSRELKRRQDAGKLYDLALLGLRFGEPDGYDLSGYHLMAHVRRFFPKTPIVIYSRHDDMRELARAFRNGASWFLRKDELNRLPEVFAAVNTPRPWEPEWRTIQAAGMVDFEFAPSKKRRAFKAAFDEARQYLTYKCLEEYPGRTICITPMGGGFSRAATFKAVKVAGRCQMQVPVVVKIADREDMRMEYERYFRFIRPYIPNDAGRVEHPERVLDAGRAAIVYTYAGSQNERRELRDLKSMMIDDLWDAAQCNVSRYRTVLNQLFDEILPRIHRVTPQSERGGRLEESSYPNPDFGELPPGDFIGNWTCRIQEDPSAPYYDTDVCATLNAIRQLIAKPKVRRRLKCPIGIVHGDLNLANVMVETYKGDTRRRGGIADAWLIDFGMTRHDYIAYDFSVLFTSALSLLFRPEGLNRDHVKLLMNTFDKMIIFAMGLVSAHVSSVGKQDKRFYFVYRLLVRIRKAALAAGVSKEMFFLSVAMGLLVNQRIQLQYERNEEASKAMLRAASVATVCLQVLADPEGVSE